MSLLLDEINCVTPGNVCHLPFEGTDFFRESMMKCSTTWERMLMAETLGGGALFCLITTTRQGFWESQSMPGMSINRRTRLPIHLARHSPRSVGTVLSTMLKGYAKKFTSPLTHLPPIIQSSHSQQKSTQEDNAFKRSVLGILLQILYGQKQREMGSESHL